MLNVSVRDDMLYEIKGKKCSVTIRQTTFDDWDVAVKDEYGTTVELSLRSLRWDMQSSGIRARRGRRRGAEAVHQGSEAMTDAEKAVKYDEMQQRLWTAVTGCNGLQSAIAAAFAW